MEDDGKEIGNGVGDCGQAAAVGSRLVTSGLFRKDKKNDSQNAYKNIMPKPQIFKSSAGRRNLLRVNGSTSASPLSLFNRRMMKAHSSWVRNFQAL